MNIVYLRYFYNGFLAGNYRCFCKCASGEEFFDDILCYKLSRGKTVMIDADGVAGIPHTFIRTVLELSVETYGINILNKIGFRCNDKYILDKLEKYKENVFNFYKDKDSKFKHPDNLKYCKRYNLDKNTKT